MADTILQAFRMSQAERNTRMKRMRRIVRKENVFWWVDSFLKAGAKLAVRSTRFSAQSGAGHKKTPNTERPTSNAQRI
jgi:trehalose-6-phosphate synthase